MVPRRFPPRLHERQGGHDRRQLHALALREEEPRVHGVRGHRGHDAHPLLLHRPREQARPRAHGPMTRRAGTLLALVATMLVVPATRVWAQCSMCQQVVTQSPEAQSAAQQLNLAILLMFFAPYVVLASLAFIVFPEPVKHLLLRLTGRTPSR